MVNMKLKNCVWGVNVSWFFPPKILENKRKKSMKEGKKRFYVVLFFGNRARRRA
jgi:hypothetical protein